MFKTKLVVGVFYIFSGFALFSQETAKANLQVKSFEKQTNSIVFNGGPILQFSTLDNELLFFIGGKASWSLKQKILFGFEGYILKSSNKSRYDMGKEISFTYAGVFTGYVFDYNPRVRLIPNMLLAWGKIGDRKVDSYGDHIFFKAIDDFVILQSGFEVDVKVVQAFRVGVGVNYKMAGDVNAVKYTNSGFSNLGFTLALKFGRI